MTTNMLQVIVQGLNAAPFNKNLSMVTFDSMSPERLLQALSDVLCWIQNVNEIDIRSEAPDETAMRILNALRVLRYPPPRDIEQVQNWRLDILEGKKEVIYPVLEWIFGNVDRLKERVYLATYLTKIEVPHEEQTAEIAKLSAIIEQKMEAFKLIHSKIVDLRGDYIKVDDIRVDLRTMEDEKEQLMRKIERSKARTSQRPDIEKHLTFAAQHRIEIEKQHELQNQRQEQRNALLHTDQRMKRLQRMVADVEKESETIDPQKFLEKYKVCTNLLFNGNRMKSKSIVIWWKTNLPKDIHALKSNIESVRKILAIKTVSQQEINDLKQRIEQLNKEVIEATVQRDKRDESNEDQLSIYRHQASGVQRKKSNLAEQLQTTRQQYEYLEEKIAQKKRELGLKTGMDELVTTVQYKNYLNKMRVKTNFYKKKKQEMDTLTSEIQVLQSTKNILRNAFESLKAEIQSEGRGILEQEITQRPQTSKPKNTDISELKGMVKELSDQLALKRNLVGKLNEKLQEVSTQHKRENEDYLANQTHINSMKSEMEREQKNAKERVNDLETQLKNADERLEKLHVDLGIHASFAESIDQPDQIESVIAKLERDNQECRSEIDKAHTQLKELAQKADAGEQIIMWKSLVQLFEKKIELQKRRVGGEGRPIGDF
ncbi:IFT81-CH domain-containing protein [Aphelenchoides bicaudatus]|nr:IFT81-CH domain-containing protein [Aphelenchoides bicaudatus]